VSSPLIRRVTQVDTQFIKELEFEPRVAAEFDFQLDSDAVLRAIHDMDFFELKGTSLRYTCTLCSKKGNHRTFGNNFFKS